MDITTKTQEKYKKAAKKEETNIQKDQTKETVGVLQESKFAPHGF